MGTSGRSYHKGLTSGVSSLMLVAAFVLRMGGICAVPSAQWRQERASATHPGANWRALSSYIDKPAFGDVTGDGVPEIIGTSVFGDVFCLDGATGRVLWSFEDEQSFDVALYICPAIVDVNCDGIPDVISIAPRGLVVCLDGRNGRKLWSYGTDAPVVSSPSVFDLKREGRPEVVIADTSGNVYLLDKSGRLIWKKAEGAPYYGTPVIGLIDDKPSVILADRAGVLRCLDATNGTLSWKSAPAKGPISTSPLVFRSDKDPANPWKALIGTDLGSLILINPKDGSVLWNMSLEEGEAVGEFALGDINGDGLPECVFSTSAFRVLAISPVDGREIWSRKLKIPLRLNPTIADRKRIRSEVLSGEPLLADVDGDGQLDVIIDIRGLNNYIYALRGRDSKVLWSLGNRTLRDNLVEGESVVVVAGPETGAASSAPAFSQATPIVADFDGDGKAELIFNDRDRQGLVSIPLGVPLKDGTWPKYAGGACNNMPRYFLPCLGTPPATELSLSMNPSEVFQGDAARLCWKSKGAERVEIDQGIGLAGPEDCADVSVNQSTVWHAHARGCTGDAAREIVLTVKVKPAVPAAPVVETPRTRLPEPTLKDVSFEEGSYLLTEGARNVLKLDALLLREAAGVRIALEAGCDEKDSMAYCQFLALARAEAVQGYLVGLEVEGSRFELRPAGGSAKWAGARSTKDRALNGLVHFQVLPPGKPLPRE